MVDEGRAVKRFWSKVDVRPAGQPGCWEWNAALKPNGYGWFCLDGKAISAHKMAWILSFGQIPQGKNVCHRCDNRKCVRPDHLWLGTQSENLTDMWRKGRGVSKPNPQSGEKHYRAKLNLSAVKLIREKRGIMSQRALAKQLGVSQRTVYEAQNGITWREVVSLPAA